MIRKLYATLVDASWLQWPGNWHLSRLPSPIIYLISVFATKSISLITIPVMAAYLSPSDYGRYDVAISFIEFIDVTLGLAIGATLIRFASTASDEEGARRAARELTGTALCISILFGIPVIWFGPFLLDGLGIATNHTALRILIAGTAFATMIELPLFWLRLKDRAGTFFVVVMSRTLAQAFLIWFMLSSGFGVAGVMIANGSVMLSIAAVLLVLQIRDTGIAVSNPALRNILVYGLPIVGADLAMFGLGSANKLFMPGHVSAEVIAHFGLAARVAMITSLAIAPFDLWWSPRRIATLNQPGGLELGARMWGIGVALIILAGAGVALGGPLVVHILLPDSYVGTIAFIAPLVVIQCLHVVTLFSNVGSYARSSGTYVFAIEVICALVAVAGYYFLIPPYGVHGVLIAMMAGLSLRLALHLWFGRVLAPLPYPWLPALASIAVAVALVIIAPPHHWLGWRFLYTGGSLCLVAAAILAVGLVKLPVSWNRHLFGWLGRSC